MLEHRKWPKIPRLYRDVLITEKVDGTNAQLLIVTGKDINDALVTEFPPDGELIPVSTHDVWILAGSRKRWLSPEADNFGFWRWVADRADQFYETLGPGRFYGEFWGHGIQRGYNMPKGERRLALFNTDFEQQPLPEGVDTVPVLYEGEFAQSAVIAALENLRLHGSYLVPGYPNPEGIVVYHNQASQGFKVTLDGDGHKGD